jgi:homocitrate synthase NifV
MLLDTTLREGEQAPGVRFTAPQRRQILSALGRARVEAIECGWAGHPDLAQTVADARRLAPHAGLAVWCRTRADDVARAAAVRPDWISVGLPGSDLHLERRLHRDRAWALAQPAALAALGHAHGCAIALGIEDATRADPTFVAELAAAAESAGIRRLRLADTCGLGEPDGIARLVAQVRPYFSGVLGLHLHDDFGLAMGNAVAGIGAGADSCDGSLLGLGERAGIVASERLAGWACLRRGGSGLHLPPVLAAARRLATWTSRTIDPDRPLLGSGLFTCESGIHLHGLLRDPRTFEPYDPALVGATRQAVRSWKGGRTAAVVMG